MDPQHDPDVQRMIALQNGDLTAFDFLFRKYVPDVVRFARRFVGSSARAEELAQDVFLQLFKTRDRYQPTARFKSWLYRMVSNACLSDLRSADRRYRLAEPAGRGEAELGSVPGVPESALPPSRSSEDEVLGEEAITGLQQAVEALPPQQRAALLLNRAEGLSYEEIAIALDTSVSAVKSLIHRATVTLSGRIAADAGGSR